MSSAAVEASEISPLRTPRERDWPRPMMFGAPEGFTSPTTAQTLLVPISKPTMMDSGSNIFWGSARAVQRKRSTLSPAHRVSHRHLFRPAGDSAPYVVIYVERADGCAVRDRA